MNQPVRLVDRIRAVARLEHWSDKAEKSYLDREDKGVCSPLD